MSSPSVLTDAFVGALRDERARRVRLRQGLTTVAVLVVAGVETAFSPGGYHWAPFVGTLVAVVVLAVLVLAVPWDRLPDAAADVPPALMLVAVGLLHASGPPTTLISNVAVLPAVWLGLQARWRGVVVATATSALVALSTSLAAGDDQLPVARAADIVVPLMVLSVSAVMAVVHGLWDDQHDRLVAQGEQLERTAEAAGDQAHLLAAVFDVVDAGLLVLDERGEFQRMNAAIQRMRAEIGGESVDRAGAFLDVYEADRSTPVAPAQMPTARAVRGEVFHGHTYWFGQQSARQLAANVSARPVTGRDGEHRGSVVVYHDVTDLMLALQTRDDFVASVSHELRTPLTSIIGYIELLEDEPGLSPGVRRQLDVVGRNAERLLGLVSDLLAVARAEDGTIQVRPVPSDLADIVARAMVSAQVRADAQGVTLLTHAAPIAPVLLDPQRIGQVVDNLVSNAVKYTPAGGTVTATVRPDGDEAVVSVADTGIGMGEDDLAMLFTKFFRAREVERRAIPGVGLGLVITRAIVEQHGGRIDVTSRPGAGTTVTVRLPR